MLSVDAPNVVVEAVKRADGDPDALIIRLYEAWGERGPVVVRGPWEIGRAVRTDPLERELAEAPWRGNEVDLDLGPFEIATLKLERAAG
jgi:alpha-mannosidase